MLILKVSYNRGADLMACLAAVKTGSTDCLQGVAAEVQTATGLGVPSSNRVVGTPADQIIVLGNSLAGYAQTKSGRHVVFMIAVGNVPISTPEEFLTVTDDQARMVVAHPTGPVRTVPAAQARS